MGLRSRGRLCIVPLERGAIAYPPKTSFDLLHFHVTRSALDGIAGARRIDSLRLQPGVNVRDPIVSQLGLSLLPALEQPRQANKLFGGHVVSALHAHLAQAYGGMRISPRGVPGGLAPWQERRAKEIMSAHLDGRRLATRAAGLLKRTAGHCPQDRPHTRI